MYSKEEQDLNMQLQYARLTWGGTVTVDKSDLIVMWILIGGRTMTDINNWISQDFRLWRYSFVASSWDKATDRLDLFCLVIGWIRRSFVVGNSDFVSVSLWRWTHTIHKQTCSIPYICTVISEIFVLFIFVHLIFVVIYYYSRFQNFWVSFNHELLTTVKIFRIMVLAT